jgi:hypothetical protein
MHLDREHQSVELKISQSLLELSQDYLKRLVRELVLNGWTQIDIVVKSNRGFSDAEKDRLR